MPWDIILGLIMKVLGLVLDKRTKNAAAKDAFIDFVNTIENMGLASVNLNEKDRAQKDELQERRDRLNRK